MQSTDIWTTPKKDEDDCLFMDNVGQLLSALHIAGEELDEWHRRGWVSFNQEWSGAIASPLCSEVEFIRNLARSGLAYSQIDEMLQFLPKPYRYQSELVAFHPRYKWVSPK